MGVTNSSAKVLSFILMSQKAKMLVPKPVLSRIATLVLERLRTTAAHQLFNPSAGLFDGEHLSKAWNTPLPAYSFASRLA